MHVRARSGSRYIARRCQVSDGEIDAQTVRFDAIIGTRAVGVAGIIKRFFGPHCVGVCIEEPFSGQFSSGEALYPMLGAATVACELEGLP